ncbi:uncharacterized protein ACBR49_013672 isoform 2-T2 [Aulostomus maculatus]
MPKKNKVVKDSSVPRFPEDSRLLRAHESLVDFIQGRSTGSFLNALASGLFSFDIFRNFEQDLDEYEYSDDDEDDAFYPQNAARSSLQPHPRIKQLTEEEADKCAKELMEEEERQKERAERKKRKKLRKKEKKRLEKENPVTQIPPEEEDGKSDSENQEGTQMNESKAEVDQVPAENQNESSFKNKENIVKEVIKEEALQKDSGLNNSRSSAAKPVPEEKPNQRPARERKKEKPNLLKVEQPKEEKPEQRDVKDGGMKEEASCPTEEEYVRRSTQLAAVGNRLATSGQYQMAVESFTEAIKYNPQEFKLFGNRSLCYERLQQYEKALRDADVALTMEPNWIKGLFRKGKALCGLRRYYEASLVYQDVLKLDGSSPDAREELRQTQIFHLMEMGFTPQQSSEALRHHVTLEAAVEALFGGAGRLPPAEPPVVQEEEEEEEEGEWIVQKASRSRGQHVRESNNSAQSKLKPQPLTALPRNPVKPELFPIWVGSLAPAVTYTTLHELFSRAGNVYSIKMLLEHQCAFVNYTRKEDCDKAIECIHGMVVEGAPLTVRYPGRIPSGLGVSRSAACDPSSLPRRECFFWRTTGCTRGDCTFRHIPAHKNIDRDKFTSRLGAHV